MAVEPRRGRRPSPAQLRMLHELDAATARGDVFGRSVLAYAVHTQRAVERRGWVQRNGPMLSITPAGRAAAELHP